MAEIGTDQESTIIDVWDNPKRRWPSIVYVETTNHCNAKCLACLNHRCKRIRGIMTLDDFKIIANKVKAHGAMIGAMFCFGEPLLDPTLFEKFAYARSLGLLPAHVGFNTNVSKLTKEKFGKILAHTPNIILSFFNTGKEYERLTGLSWDESYRNAIDFINYRNAHKPGYPIFIGCNTVEGHNLQKVKNAFAGHNVRFVQDAELRWGGSVITGVIDRMIMFNDWRCDGYKGALQIKWNGDCEFCAYDIIGSPEGGETKFANILTDSWAEMDAKFRKAWREPRSICRRCDYFYKAKTVMAHGMKRPNPLPSNWYDWQKPHLKEGEDFAR